MKFPLTLFFIFNYTVIYSQYYEWGPKIIQANHVKKAILFDWMYEDIGEAIHPDFILVEYEFDTTGNMIREIYRVSNASRHGLDSEIKYYYTENNKLVMEVENIYSYFFTSDTSYFYCCNNLVIKYKIDSKTSDITSFQISKYTDNGKKECEILVKNILQGGVYLHEFEYFQKQDSFLVNESIYYYEMDELFRSQNKDLIIAVQNFSEIVDSAKRINQKSMIVNIYNIDNILIKRINENLELGKNSDESDYVISESGLPVRSYEYMKPYGATIRSYNRGFAFQYLYYD